MNNERSIDKAIIVFVLIVIAWVGYRVITANPLKGDTNGISEGSGNKHGFSGYQRPNSLVSRARA